MTKQDKKYYSLRSFGSYMARYKWRFTAVILVFTISTIALAIIPVFIGRLIGALSAQPVQGHQAVLWVWVLIACSTGHNLLWSAGELLHMRLINPLSYEYDTLLFKEVIRKPYPYFVDKFTGKLSSYIGTISQEMREFFTQITYNYTSQLVSLVVAGIILAAVNWQTGAIFVIGILSMLVVGRVTVRNSAKYEKIATDTQSNKNGKLVDAVANFVNVKSFRKEAEEWQAIAAQQQKVITDVTRSYFWSVVFWGSLSIIVRDLIWPAIIGVNVYLFLHHEISLASLTTVLSTVLIFTSTVWDLIWFASQFTLKLARIEEAHIYLFGKVNLIKQIDTAADPAISTPEFAQSLQFQSLHFAYPDKADVPVLRNIDLQLRKGEKLGIVGRSGSGKTTLTKLLLGYYPIESGILLDGEPIDTKHLARLISYVPQDTSLFHRTVAENIAYATDRKATQSEIIDAAKKAHAHEFIAQIKDGYQALVGERGVKLSAGQRQRIAIARAFLDDKPILILDEATSALDSESEVLVQEALEALWEHKTVIAIAHRLSTLRHMDRIIVMDQGRIIEQGTHQELLQKDGAYAKLWIHQSGGFLEE
jgi:ABC-type multidrug transport system fused ATPase/permease subunit